MRTTLALLALSLTAAASAQCTGDWSSVGEGGPPPRQNHGMVYDAQRGVVVLFGGYRGGFGFYDDTWEWDGLNWAQVTTTGPSARGNFAMAYDTARNKTVLFGGAGPGGAYLGDTWEYDGPTQTWTEVFPSTFPTARYNAAMAFDAARGVAVMFGGYSGVREGDTWTWDGVNWAQVATTGCTPRNGHAMAFDDARDVVVLFGGFNGARLGDTWEWNGTAWSQRSTTGPSGRQYLGLAYNPATQRTVIYGGQTGSCSLCREDDTWSWDGTAWTLLGDGQASLRDQHAMVYDAARGHLTFFGGYAGNGLVLDDTWIWRTTLTGDLDGDGAVGLADLAVLLSHFGTPSGAGAADGDMDGDTDVDLQDLATLLGVFGATCP
ncbi:MAG: hypothetical protein AMXMBFR47_03010 [Planctomycetota bacterium]